MKRLLYNGVFALLSVLVIGGCGSSTNNSNPTAVTCIPGQACNNGALATGYVRYFGSLFNINQSNTQFLQKALNQVYWQSGINYTSGDLTIIGQNLPTGGIGYFVTLNFYPQPSYYGACAVPTGIPCNQPIVISGQSSFWPVNAGSTMLQVAVAGLKVNIFIATGTAVNPLDGTQPYLNNVVVKLVKVNQDPTQGDQLANTYLTLVPSGYPY